MGAGVLRSSGSRQDFRQFSGRPKLLASSATLSSTFALFWSAVTCRRFLLQTGRLFLRSLNVGRVGGRYATTVMFCVGNSPRMFMAEDGGVAIHGLHTPDMCRLKERQRGTQR